jgi:hypothetical protein
VPGMIAFSTDQNSGMIESCKSLLVALNSFSAFSNIRAELYNNYETNLTLINLVEQLNNILEQQNKYYENKIGNKKTTNVLRGVELGVTGLDIVVLGAKSAPKIKKLRESIKDYGLIKTVVKGTMKKVKLVPQALKSFKILKDGIKIKNIMTAIKEAGVILAPETGGLSLVLTLGTLAIDVILNSFIQWLENRNVICLLPLWWEGYPMASCIKDGEHILLIDSNSTATEESVEDYKYSEASELQNED